MNFDVLKSKSHFRCMAVERCFICQCGAVTLVGYDVETDEHAEVSCAAENLEQLTGFSLEDIQTKSLLNTLDSYFQCNHCANHWGLDLCACGSGQPAGECDEHTDECGAPYQSVDEFRFLVPENRQFEQSAGTEEPTVRPRTVRLETGKPRAQAHSFRVGDKVRLDMEAIRHSEGVPFFKQMVEDYLREYHGEALEIKEIHEGEAYPYILSLGDDIAFDGQELILVQPERKGGNGLSGAVQLQRQLKAELKGFVGSLTDKIRETPVPGVSPIGSSACFTVNISSIMRAPGHVLSAEYYSSQSQANLVSKALAYDAANGRVEEMLQHLHEMVNKKSVEINKVRYPLNETTVNILNLAVAGMEDA